MDKYYKLKKYRRPQNTAGTHFNLTQTLTQIYNIYSKIVPAVGLLQSNFVFFIRYSNPVDPDPVNA